MKLASNGKTINVVLPGLDAEYTRESLFQELAMQVLKDLQNADLLVVLDCTPLMRPGPQLPQFGVPDIVVCVDGRFVGIELKSKVNKNPKSPAQDRFRKRLEAAGGTYVLARTLRQVLEAVGAEAADG